MARNFVVHGGLLYHQHLLPVVDRAATKDTAGSLEGAEEGGHYDGLESRLQWLIDKLGRSQGAGFYVALR